MPFKIVQTIENGKHRLSTIPSVWEENGKLFWPSQKIKNRTRLVREETSFPSPNWDILDCVVKRTNIQTYMAAEREIQIMENQTDTDNETPAATASYRSASDINTFENIVQDLVYDDNNVVDPHPPAEVSQITNETLNLLPTLDCDELISNQNLLLQKIDKQDKILNNILECMQKLTQKVATLSVLLNEGLATITEKIDVPVDVTLLKDANPEENERFNLEQIDDKQKLEILENNLMDKAERSKLQKQLSFLFQPCEGHGLTFAYKLLDSSISREFLCKCSWSGASRGNLSKIGLKYFKNFIKFFCDMIRSWDCTFTMAQTEKFLKMSLKNAVKRNAMKNLRSSSTRTRKTKPKSQNSEIQTNELKESSSKVPTKAINDPEDNSRNNQIDEISMEVEKGVPEESDDEALC